MNKNAVLSVFHKDGIVEFAKALIALGYTIYASGGTYKHLIAHGVAALPVSDIVGGEAIFGHRVVTLSRRLYAGILATGKPEDLAELARLAIPRIHLVCVDMYPLEQEIAKEGSTRASVIEQTDIGGPTMIRAAAKGEHLVVCDPKDRQSVIEWIKAGEPDNGFAQSLAAKGEFTVAKYCMASAAYLSGNKYDAMFGVQVATCKYGENPWQTPAHAYSCGTNDPLAIDKFELIEGLPPSHINMRDLDRLLQTGSHIMAAFGPGEGVRNAIAIGVKHGNACGAAIGLNPADVLQKMLVGDPISIMGGFVLVNFEITESLVGVFAGKIFDGIVAPSVTAYAVEQLRRKKTDKCRFMVNPALTELALDQAPLRIPIRGGYLKQPNYTFVPKIDSDQVTKYGKATPQQERDMLLGWAIGSTSNSNTIAIVKNGQLLANATGQQDRVGAADLAIARGLRAKHDLAGASAYSDSFFPFPDGPLALIKAGIGAIYTSSGSTKDGQTIALCAEHNIPLYMIPDKEGRGFFGH